MEIWKPESGTVWSHRVRNSPPHPVDDRWAPSMSPNQTQCQHHATASATIGGGPSAGIGATSHQVTGDDQQVVLTTGDEQPGPGQAHVYRVTATQQGQVFGGYTVVLLGPPAP